MDLPLSSSAGRKRLGATIAGGLAGVACTAVASSVLAGWGMVRRGRRWFACVPPTLASLDEVTFPSQDGLLLRGWLLAAEGARDVVILCHGWQNSRAETAELGLALYQRGHSVLLFDFRACGRSEGRFTSAGYHEVKDLLGAVEFVRRRLGVPVGVVGLSMGGAVALMAAARCADILAVVADSAFATLGGVVDRGIERFRLLPPLASRSLALRVARCLVGASPAQVRPVDEVSAIAPRPVLLIHGSADSLVPPEHGRLLHQAAGEPKELWLAEGSEHCTAREDYPGEYLQRVEGFLTTHLGRLRAVPAADGS